MPARNGGPRKRLSVIEFSSKSACVVDNGLFAGLAERLAQSFGKVYYTSPWVADFPVSTKIKLAEGFPDFERVKDIWEIVDDVDLFVFPDLYNPALQMYLQDKGKRVWGSRYGEELEINRKEALEYFDSLGLPLVPYKVCEGMTELRKYLQSRPKEKLWIKIGLARGDTETFSIENFELGQGRLDDLQAKLGPVAESHYFIVEDDVPGMIDVGLDTYSIDGKFPSKCLLGIEKKDEGYIGAVKGWKELPSRITDMYEALTPALKEYQYRNLFAIEARVLDQKDWLGDPCCRFGSPVSELELSMIQNLPEIIWEGADGKLVEPKYTAKYGFEMLIQSAWAMEHPMKVEFPEKYRDQVKFRYATQFEDGLWTMPQKDGPQVVCAVCATGNSVDECMAEADEIGEEIRGTKLEVLKGSEDGLKQYLEQLAEWQIPF